MFMVVSVNQRRKESAPVQELQSHAGVFQDLRDPVCSDGNNGTSHFKEDLHPLIISSYPVSLTIFVIKCLLLRYKTNQFVRCISQHDI